MVDITDQTPDTGAELYFDAALRHHVGVRRFAAGEVAQILRILELSDRELTSQLRTRLGRLAGTTDFTSERFRQLIADIREIRRSAIRQIRQMLRQDLIRLARNEQDFEQRILAASLPVQLTLAVTPAVNLRQIVTRNPFSGGINAARTLNQWFQSIERADRSRIVEAIQLGMSQGETVDQITRRMAGTRREGFRDGILALSRRNAETLTRTAINHVSNAAREELWKANSDLFQAIMWTSTLDGRTSPICRDRDGRIAVIGDRPFPPGFQRLQPPGARPPAHPSCRSVTIVIFDLDNISDQLPERPMVRDVRTRRFRERDFRAEARARVGDSRWRRLTETQRRSRIRNIRREWVRENVGRVPGTITYDQWLRRQPATFQDQVLGKTKGVLFRRGDLRVSEFVDRQGNELTLDQLARTRPEAFERAGLEPDNF